MLVQKNLPHGNLSETLDSIILSVVEMNNVIPNDYLLQETNYYIGGWLICAIEKESARRKATLSKYLEQIAANSCELCN